MAQSKKNTSVLSVHLAEIVVRALTHYKAAKIALSNLWTLKIFLGEINIAIGTFRVVAGTTKISEFLFRAALTNSFLFMSLT